MEKWGTAQLQLGTPLQAGVTNSYPRTPRAGPPRPRTQLGLEKGAPNRNCAGDGKQTMPHTQQKGGFSIKLALTQNEGLTAGTWRDENSYALLGSVRWKCCWHCCRNAWHVTALICPAGHIRHHCPRSRWTRKDISPCGSPAGLSAAGSRSPMVSGMEPRRELSTHFSLGSSRWPSNSCRACCSPSGPSLLRWHGDKLCLLSSSSGTTPLLQRAQCLRAEPLRCPSTGVCEGRAPEVSQCGGTAFQGPGCLQGLTDKPCLQYRGAQVENRAHQYTTAWISKTIPGVKHMHIFLQD